MAITFTVNRTGSKLSLAPPSPPVTITVGATPVTGGTPTFLLSTNGTVVTLTDPATLGGGSNAVFKSLTNADSVTLPIGTPVSAQSPGVVQAKSSDATRPAVGVVAAAGAVGVACLVQLSGALQLSDWTAVLGVASLVPRQLYFVDPVTPGKLTMTVPTTAGQLLQIVGVGLTTDTLGLQIEQPLLL